MKFKVFLGGTVDHPWRKVLIPYLNVAYFNPIVDNWTEERIKIEDDEKENKCNIHLYVITVDQYGVYSIAEIMDSVHQKGKYTIMHVIPDGFDDAQLKSLEATLKLVEKRGGIAYMDSSIMRASNVINHYFGKRQSINKSIFVDIHHGNKSTIKLGSKYKIHIGAIELDGFINNVTDDLIEISNKGKTAKIFLKDIDKLEPLH